MKRVDVAILGAGPAGLAAAVETAGAGLETLLLDSNLRVGGQLIKQIHKFFGSRAHRAGTRGIDIARELAHEASAAGAELWLDSTVHTLGPDGSMEVVRGSLEHAGDPSRVTNRRVAASRVIVATGAGENAVAFAGWTLPGVMGAGAAQTMVNVHRVLPGRRVVMIGSGNVGLIVSYQLLQAGAEVVAVVEAAPCVGGYGVHSAKICRAGVPILTSTTVKEAGGEGTVEWVALVELDPDWRPVSGTERTLQADTVCIATGLRPDVRLTAMAGCRLVHQPALGGWVPWHDRHMRSSLDGIYVAGDLAGVEEASTAMEEGRLAGVAAAESLGALPAERGRTLRKEIWGRLDGLRMGPFGAHRRRAKAEVMKGGGAI